MGTRLTAELKKGTEFVTRFFSTTRTPRVLGVVVALGLLCATLMPVTRAASQAARPASASPVGQAARQAAPEALPQTIAFNRDVRPILSDKCFKCHGPGTQMKTLRFDLEEVAKQALPDGRVAIVPGDVAKSEMIQRVTA